MQHLYAIFLIAALAFLLAGFVKGVIGMGLPTVAIGLLSVVMKPSEAAVLLIVPTIVTNIWQLAVGSNLIVLTRRLFAMLAISALVTFAAAGLLTGAGERATLALGIALAGYPILGLAKVRF